jgi:hypothetical protein
MFLLLFIFLQSTDTISSVQFYGSSSSPYTMMDELWDIKKGDAFSIRELNKNRNRLIKSGYFSQVQPLFYKKDSSYQIKLYLTDKTNFDSFSFYPTIDNKKNFGLGFIYNWHFVNNTTSSMLTDLYVSKNDYKYHFGLYDLYWFDSFYYKMDFYYNRFLYPYTNLSESEKYLQKSFESRVEFATRLSAEENLSIILGLKEYNLSEGIFKDSIQKINETRVGLAYQINNFDWQIYARDGYFINFNGHIQKIDKSEITLFSYSYYSFIHKISKNNSLMHTFKTGFTNKAVKIFNLFHYDSELNYDALFFQDLAAERYLSIVEQIRLPMTIIYDPNLEENFCYGLDLGLSFTYFETQEILNQSSANRRFAGLITFNAIALRKLWALTFILDDKSNFNILLKVGTVPL